MHYNESVDAFSEMTIFSLLIPPIHEHEMSFHVLVSSSVSLQRIKCSSLVRLIPRYF